MEWSGTFRQEKNIFFVPYLTRPHIMRHSFASRCYEARMDPKVLQKIMGHAKINTTMDIYTHISESRTKKEMSILESVVIS